HRLRLGGDVDGRERLGRRLRRQLEERRLRQRSNGGRFDRLWLDRSVVVGRDGRAVLVVHGDAKRVPEYHVQNEIPGPLRAILWPSPFACGKASQLLPRQTVRISPLREDV